MRGFDVPGVVTQRVLARCGVEHPHANLDPRCTALVVVDLQNAFMDDAVGHAVCPMAREIVPNVNRLASAVRAVGGGVFWIRNTCDARTAFEWSNADAMLTPASRDRRAGAMSEGSKGQELWPELDVRAEDEVVRKYRFSAFMPGTCELPYRLRARGLDTGADHGDGDQCLLRILGTRCHDDQFQDDHGKRRERRDDRGGAQRLVGSILRNLR
jgi:hypothetical protein